MSNDWTEVVLQNFEKASPKYNDNADLQRIFASRLAKECSKHFIPGGIWVDLGAGTGLLAEALETLNPNQAVLRVDKSQKMLKGLREGKSKQHNLSA